MTSPRFRPTFHAGEPGCTPPTIAGCTGTPIWYAIMNAMNPKTRFMNTPATKTIARWPTVFE